jgi:type VI secretion system protein VasD
MKRKHPIVLSSLLLLALIMSIGCSKEPPRVAIVLNAGADVNPDQSGQALSVVVRIYQLKDKGRMESADYNSIWRSDTQTLSEDLLERQERIIQPGTQEMLEIRVNPSAAYLGIVALFRSPTGDTWRRIVPVGQSETQRITLALRGQNIEIISTGR